jgi:hypothetical protein
MNRSALDWLMKVAIATAALAGLAAFAGAGRALAADETVAAAGSPFHAAFLFLVAWLLSTLRLRRRGGRLVLAYELSPVRRVIAASTARRARRNAAASPVRATEL